MWEYLLHLSQDNYVNLKNTQLFVTPLLLANSV